MQFPRIATLRTPMQFQARLDELQLQLPFSDSLHVGEGSPLAQPLSSRAGEIGNRFCILPMEGWDGTADGRPTELTKRRWERFGLSGAKLIWGGGSCGCTLRRAGEPAAVGHQRTKCVRFGRPANDSG